MRSLLFLFLVFSPFAFSQDKGIVHPGKWLGQLAMNDRLFIPFTLEIKELKNKPVIEIVNGKERIPLKLTNEGDSVLGRFPELDAYLKFRFNENGEELSGYWLNLNKKTQIKIPINAWLDKTVTEMAFGTSTISGKWKATFSPNSENPDVTVGIFEQTAGLVNGTFLTETGDYRFLSGTIGAGQFSMSTFNGSWAFLFEGKVVNDSIYGKFYSGPNYQTDWFAVKDPNATLRDPSKLTYVENDKDFNFSAVKTLKGKSFDYKKASKNKVVIYQIMGTWCPNCIDELHYFKELHKKYNNQGLEIVALAYEIGTNEKNQIKRLKAFKKRLSIPYEVVLAGTSSKDIASTQFPMLNGIMSFPTSVVVGRNGKIEYVHTGFSGPATGKVYEEYRKEMEMLIERLFTQYIK
ncbi:MAG: TlpA disulfide reductase family protein [Bacteroidota bacterium]